MLSFLRTGPLAPLFECGFRPFFLLTAASAVIALAAWTAFFAIGLPLPATPGGPAVWHAHAMLYGFAMASVAGFVLTAIPEFTATRAIQREPVFVLLVVWLAGRLASALPGVPGAAVVAMLADTVLLVGLVALVAARLWRDPDRRHLSFLWALLAMTGTTVGFHVQALAGADPMRWLLLMTGLLMALIIVAMSRISMRIVNAALEEAGDTAVEYLARPPRRNLAIFCILLYTGMEFVAPGHPVSGWVALAAGAALLNLLNDWHIGRALLQRWAFLLYLVYWFMALGYAVMGMALLTDTPWVSAGRHLAMIGAMGLAIFAVLNIAGRVHAGFEPDRRAWVPVAVALIAGAALLRAAIGFGPVNAGFALAAASACWIGAFGLHLTFHWPVLTHPRSDGQRGCAGLADD
ncbi:MAG TPA: NnrS family protein [Rhodocyclaceae bacterium]|nr:NnrS family protein [Rhodocyclaceae bacterium]